MPVFEAAGRVAVESLQTIGCVVVAGGDADQRINPRRGVTDLCIGRRCQKGQCQNRNSGKGRQGCEAAWDEST